MAVNKGEIGIYGILRRDGGDNILAKTDQIQDDKLQKTQEQLNQEAVNGAALATAHIANTNNPHNVTKAQVGLDKVTNDEQVKRTEMGKPLGVATLDGLGKVPSSQLPAYVDDVVEYETVDDFPKYGESGKIYVETTTNLTYRWTGTQYIEISKSIGLGETDSTAYPGNKGKQVADELDTHIKDTTNPHNVTKEQLGLDKVDNTPDSEKEVKNADTVDGYHATDGRKFTSPLQFQEDSLPKADVTDFYVTGISSFENGGILKWADFKDINVGSATKLKTPIKIWGQNFDGSKNIEGNLIGVSGINFQRDISITFNDAGNIQMTQDSDANFWCIFPYGSTSVAFSVLSKSGNIGIKTSSPKYPLDVIGIVNTNNNYYKNGEVYAEAVSDTEIETMLNDLGI